MCDYHRKFDPESDSILYNLLRVLACYENRPVTDLPPISTAVDPEALEGVLDGRRRQYSREEVKVEFDYDGVHVKVSSTGDVWIWEPNNSNQ